MIFYVVSLGLLFAPGSLGEELVLTSDGPVVLDAEITFTGSLMYPDPTSTYRWQWQDDASPVHSKIEDYLGAQAKHNYTITYPAAEYDETRYSMKLSIFKSMEYYWDRVVSETIEFDLKRTLSGKLLVRQAGKQSEAMSGQSIVNSINKTEIVIEFHDPSNFLKKASRIQYFWFIDTVNYGQTNQPVFNYNFSTAGDYLVESTVIADFNATGRSTLSAKDMPHLQQRSLGVKMGIFHKRVVSKDPISNLTVDGQKTLKHGQLVDLNILCGGSGPWLFCWKIVEKGYNITGNETCHDPKYREDCEFSLLWYFKKSDTYNLLLIVSNDVSSHLEVVAVSIYEVASQLPLSIVIIPVTAGMAAVILLISGIGVYTAFKSNLAVEVADFDFNTAEEEELQYKTFWERLRESFGTAFTSGGDVESEGSSVSGRRSVQLPGAAGIGYGSIT